MPSYNYRCKECAAECVYSTGPSQVLAKEDLYCENCGSPKMELVEYSEKEDLQNKKIVSEIVDLNERIGVLVHAIDEVRKRIDLLEDFSSSDFLQLDDSLLN